MEIFRKGRKEEFNKKDDNEKFIKQQSKLTFNESQKPFTNYDSYIFEQN